MCYASFQPILNQSAQANPAINKNPMVQHIRERASAPAGLTGSSVDQGRKPPSEGGVTDSRPAANKSRTILEGPVRKLQGKTMLGT